MKVWRILVALAFLWPGALGAQSVFLAPSGATAAGLPAGLFADPRDFGATCGKNGSATWSQNNATNDDAPGINAALATGLPVVIPYPGCKAVTQIVAPMAGATLFSFGGSGPYDALGVCDGSGSSPAITRPVLCVPDAATGATNKCIFDTVGLDGVTWNNITVIGTSMFNGVSAFCNSVGIANGRPQAFAHLNDVSITGMAGIGTAADGTCAPTGTLSTPVFQLVINNLVMGHDCWGIYANYSDTFIENVLMANIYNSCIASTVGGGIALSASNWRCEFTGHFDANPVLLDGAAFYLSDNGFSQLSNISFDHVMGSCITMDGNNGAGGSQSSGWSSISNIRCKDSVSGGAVADGGVIPTVSSCNFVLQNQVKNITAVGITGQDFTNLQRYDLCFVGTQSDRITWMQSSGAGPDTFGGWHTAFINGTLPTNSVINALDYGVTRSDAGLENITYPTTCTAMPTGTTANISGFLKVCP